MSKVAIYVRLSKEDENKGINDDSQSIQNQKMMLLDYCLKNNLEVYGIYNDDDYKGTDSQRPAFNRLLQDAKDRCFDIILCKSQSRFTREMEVVEKYLHGLFVLWNIRFISLVDHVDTFNQGNKKARQINGLINEWYLEDMSNNIKQTFLAKCASGKHIGSFACFGYLKDPDIKGKLIVDKQAAEVVRLIYDLYLQGLGQLKIAQYLNAKGFLNPTAYKQSIGLNYRNGQIKGSNWSTSSIRLILSNEMYIGNLVQHCKTSLSYKSKKQIKVAKDQWVVVANNHEAIIDRDCFNRVQLLMKQKRKKHCYYQKSKYGGLLKCGYCHYRLVSNSWKKERYYRCSLRLRNKDSCQGMMIKESILDYLLFQEVSKLVKVIDQKELYENLNINQRIKKQIMEIIKAIKNDQNELDKYQRQLKELYFDKLNQVISKEEYLIYRNEMNDKIKNIEEMIIDRKNKLIKLKRQRKEFDIKAYIKDMKISKELLKIMIEEIEIVKDKIVVKWKF